MPNSLKTKTAVYGSKYYLSRLTDEQKGFYKTVLSGIKNHLKEIYMPLMPTGDLIKIFSYVLLDNPMIFFLSSSYSHTSDSNKQQCAIIPEYKFTQNETNEYVKDIMEYLKVFDSLKDKSDFDKELYVHDFCLNNFSYDYTFGDKSYSVLGLVHNKAAVCEGIAKFVKLAFDYLGVKSLVVTGEAKNPGRDSKEEGHAWNIVKLAGKTYHLDVTFDMTLKDKINRYDYFNLSDDEVKKDHIFFGDVPPCSATGDDFYSINSLFVNNMGELENFIGEALKHGKRHILVKIKNEPYTDEIANRILAIAQKRFSRIYLGSITTETNYNSCQMVFEIMFNGG